MSGANCRRVSLTAYWLFFEFLWEEWLIARLTRGRKNCIWRILMMLFLSIFQKKSRRNCSEKGFILQKRQELQ